MTRLGGTPFTITFYYLLRNLLGNFLCIVPCTSRMFVRLSESNNNRWIPYDGKARALA